MRKIISLLCQLISDFNGKRKIRELEKFGVKIRLTK